MFGRCRSNQRAVEKSKRIGSLALGAAAVGAIAVGSVALGALAIGAGTSTLSATSDCQITDQGAASRC